MRGMTPRAIMLITIAAMVVISVSTVVTGAAHSTPAPEEISVDTNAWERGYHHPLYTQTITPAIAGNNQVVTEQGVLAVNQGAIRFNTTTSTNIVRSPNNIVFQGRTTLDPADTTVFEDTVSLNGNTLGNTSLVEAKGSTLELASATTMNLSHAGSGNSIRVNTGELDLVVNDAGELSFIEGIPARQFTASIPGVDNGVPVSGAYPGYVWGEIQANHQDLNYTNTDNLTETYPSAEPARHEVSIVNGSDTTVRDYYIPDDQNLTVTNASATVSNQTSHAIRIDNGNTVTVRDYYERDTTVADNQNVTSSRSGKTVTIATNEGGGGDSFTDHVTTYTDGDGILLSGETFSVSSPSCADDEVLNWSGSAFTCEQKHGPYSTGRGMSKTGDTLSSTGGTAITATTTGHQFDLSDATCGPDEYLQGISGGSLVCANSCGDIGCREDVEDTDSGNDLVDRGTCTNYKGCNATNCQENASQDYCTGDDITEFYVSGDSCTSSTTNCDSICRDGKKGLGCSSGSCDVESTKCTNQCFGPDGNRPGTGCSTGDCTKDPACPTGASDSDGGVDTDDAGTCTDYNGCSTGSCDEDTYDDYCTNSTELVEYYTDGNSCASSKFSCSYGCTSGSCDDPPTVTCYPDDDGDGYGDESASGITRNVSCPDGEVQDNDDCYDENAQVYPGQTNYFVDGYGPSGENFDYNCDGEEEIENSPPGGERWGWESAGCPFDQEARQECRSDGNVPPGCKKNHDRSIGWTSPAPSCGEISEFGERTYCNTQYNEVETDVLSSRVPCR